MLAINDNEGNHQDQVKELIEKTANSLDVLALKMLFVSVQKNNLELCIKYAIYAQVFSNKNLTLKMSLYLYF